MPTFTIQEDAPILVEFAYQPGLQETSLSAADLAERSARALDSAMGTIQQMARRVVRTVNALHIAERPKQVEIEFNLKLDAEVGAIVAQASAEAGFNVKLTWEREKPTRPSGRGRSR